MNAAAAGIHVGGVAASATGPRVNVRRLQLAILWTVGFAGAFVRFEPAPYDGLIVFATFAFALTGLKLRPGHIPLVLLMIGTSIAYGVSVLPVLDKPDTLKWSAVSAFLALSSIFFALALAEDTERRLNVLIGGYIASATIAAVIAAASWFHAIPNADFFLWVGRARGTFKDPNVFGPFMVLPCVVVAGRLLAGQYRSLIFSTGLLGLMCLAVLLTFSRGAWGHLAVAIMLMAFFNFLTAQSNKERTRIVCLAALGAVAATLALLLVLSIGSVGSMFSERAELVQGYDAGPQGRFGRYIPGFLLMLEHPLGIGPLQFTHYFPEDPHNSFLDAFVAGGWLGGVTHFTLMAMTLLFGLRHVFIRTPWQRTYIAVFATFAAELGESIIIDVQHWRHFYLLIGVLWGLIALARSGVAPGENAPYNPPRRSVAQPG